MSFFVFKGKKIYYECHGEGSDTLLILNGIMMSSASWKPFIPFLSKTLKVILMDFVDQGQSEYWDASETYDQSFQADTVKALFDYLQLKEVSLLGISYGGEVAMRLAACMDLPLKNVILANTTAYTNRQLKAIGDNWVHAAQTYDGKKFFKATIPPIYSTAFYEKNTVWLSEREELFSKAFDARWYEGFIRLVRSAETHDLRTEIAKIHVPTLVIGSDNDLITPLPCQREVASLVPGAVMLTIENCGHASMYEQPHAFFTAVLGFIQTGHQTFQI